MNNPWQIYDDLLDLVPGDRRVASCAVSHWAAVADDQGHAGVAMVYRDGPHDLGLVRDFVGKPLRDLAAQVRSWDLELASLGAAALNCGLTTPERLEACPQRDWAEGVRSTFDLHAADIAGRSVAVVGHFGSIGAVRERAADLVVLERRPTGADLPDPAAEFVIPGRDLVFITGSTLINKTLPRLLQLAAGADVVLVGPSTPLAPEVFAGQVSELGGSLVVEPAGLVDLLAAGTSLAGLRPRMRPYNALIPVTEGGTR